MREGLERDVDWALAHKADEQTALSTNVWNKLGFELGVLRQCQVIGGSTEAVAAPALIACDFRIPGRPSGEPIHRPTLLHQRFAVPRYFNPKRSDCRICSSFPARPGGLRRHSSDMENKTGNIMVQIADLDGNSSPVSLPDSCAASRPSYFPSLTPTRGPGAGHPPAGPLSENKWLSGKSFHPALGNLEN